ncbi:MAG: hypothetical protein WD068_03315 [Candidatus Babeliales bacterium]
MKKTPHILAFLLICTALPIQSQSRLTAKTKVLIGTLVGGGITLILGAYGLKKYRAHKNSSNVLQPLLRSDSLRSDSPISDSPISDSPLHLALHSKNPFENIQALITGGAVVTKQNIDYAQENGASDEILALLKLNLYRVEFDELCLLHKESNFNCNYPVLLKE